MLNLTIAHIEISQLDGFFSLNALHKASGKEGKHQPNRFFRTKQTQDLITEIEQTPNMGFALKTKAGGAGGSNTYACKELVYAYAMWISPKFNLMVIRAFDALQTSLQPADDGELPLLLTEITQLKQQLSQQNEMLELYRFKAGALEQQTQPRPKRASKGPVTPAEREAIIKMHWAGLSRGEMAKSIDRSTSAVYTVLREYKAGVTV